MKCNFYCMFKMIFVLPDLDIASLVVCTWHISKLWLFMGNMTTFLPDEGDKSEIMKIVIFS